jgi:hypothetical protein
MISYIYIFKIRGRTASFFRKDLRIDSKYSNCFTKKANLPIVMIANHLPDAFNKKGPLKERLYPWDELP